MDGHEKRGLVSQAPVPIDCLPRVYCVALAILSFLHVRIGGGGGQDSRPPLMGCTWRYRVAGRVCGQALVQLALIYNAVSLRVAMAVALLLGKECGNL